MRASLGLATKLPATFLLLFLLNLLRMAPTLQAQSAGSPLAGEWVGSIDLPGAALELSLLFEAQKDGSWAGRLNIPAQRIKEMALADLRVTSDSISFRLPEVPGDASFQGAIKPELIEGTFRQAGQRFPMRLRPKDEKAEELLAQKVAFMERLIDSLREKADVPGLGVGIIYQGEVLMEKGFGYRNVEDKRPVSARTLFAIGSSSKAFTAAGLAMLADEGKLEWDKPVRDYMSDFQLYDEYATQKMTATDLLCHRSGLPRHDLAWYATPFSREELYHRLRYLEPNVSFREKWQYQNLMYMTAGCLTEKLSGMSWEDFMQTRLFDPLGMRTANTSIAKMEKNLDFAYGYGMKSDSVQRLPFHPLDAVGPAGSINASARDMLQWLKLQLGNGTIDGKELVSAEQMQFMHRPHMVMEGGLINLPAIKHPAYGLGWFVSNYDGLYVVEHGGNIDGFSALVFMIPDSDLGMVFLSNMNGTSLTYTLAYTLTDVLLNRKPTDWFGLAYPDEDEDEDEDKNEDNQARRVAGTRPAHALKAYVGKYEHPGYGILEIKLQGDSLLGSYYNFSIPLSHWHFETFKGKEASSEIDVELQFLTDASGLVYALKMPLELTANAIEFTRLPSEQLKDPAFLAMLAGKYEIEGQQFSVTANGRQLTVKIGGQPEITLVPYQNTEFKLKGIEGYRFEFILENDKPVAVISHQPNGSFRAERIAE